MEDAKFLLSMESYKSANNRSYYSMEKSVGGLLAYKQISYKSHNGIIHQFNNNIVNDSETPFDNEDYKMFARTETIRSLSDYNDFFIANKEQTRQAVDNAEYLYKKSVDYLEQKLGINLQQSDEINERDFSDAIDEVLDNQNTQLQDMDSLNGHLPE